jgi:hypothetical protein
MEASRGIPKTSENSSEIVLKPGINQNLRETGAHFHTKDRTMQALQSS